jgi:hypothetical protein
VDRYDVKESNNSKEGGKTKIIDTLETGKDDEVPLSVTKFDREMYDYLIFQIYTYRSYGYVAIEKYEYALEDIARAKRLNKQ